MSVMFWQFMNDFDGQIISNVLQSAGRTTRQQAIKGQADIGEVSRVEEA